MRSLVLLAALLLAGCAEHHKLPDPHGPLQPLNPGLWNFNDNPTVPRSQETR